MSILILQNIEPSAKILEWCKRSDRMYIHRDLNTSAEPWSSHKKTEHAATGPKAVSGLQSSVVVFSEMVGVSWKYYYM